MPKLANKHVDRDDRSSSSTKQKTTTALSTTTVTTSGSGLTTSATASDNNNVKISSSPSPRHTQVPAASRFYVLMWMEGRRVTENAIPDILTFCISRLGWTDCPELRPYQFGPMHILEHNHKVTGYKVVNGREVGDKWL